MIRRIIALLALLAAPLSAQSLTLTNLKGPIARICATKPATSIAGLWKQLDACPPAAQAPAPTPTPAPPFTAAERAALLWPAAIPPKSPPPEDVGNFRFICTAGQANYDDAILYPGVIGGSPHLHRYYGNLLANAKATHASLMAAGDSSCSNALNRSAYWVPALLTGDGKSEIIPAWIGIYYKRMPASDPNCLKLAAKGCVGLPKGLRVVSGFDMKRMHDAQPENITFSHRCGTEGKPSIHRRLLADAVADCGGAGLIVSAISFGDCWTGELDSPDHRAHLTIRRQDGYGNAKCPASHPYIIPQLSQLVAYDIERGDGAIYFASDRMPGMDMPPGFTFHADYMEGWDEPTRLAWEANCIDKMLNCSDGDLGNGTQLKRPVLTYKAAPRLVPVLARPMQ